MDKISDIGSKMTRIFLLFVTLLLAHCSSISENAVDKDNNGEVIYSVDKVGVFVYNCDTKTSKKIFSSDKIFLSSSLQFINDTLIIVGHQSSPTKEEKPRIVNSKYFYRADGDSTFITDNPPYKVFDKYTYLQETFYAVNINTGESWKYKTIDYQHKEYDSLTIKATFLSRNGTVVKQADSLIICSGITSSYKGIRYCDVGRFYSKSEIANGRQVFSKRGDLILKENNKETILLKFDGHFDPKFGSGYFNPTISADGKKVAYQYLAGFLNSGSGIFEINIESKEKNKIIGEGYFDPKYSPDGNRLLVAKDTRKGNEKTWISDIYILNIRTGKKNKITEGDNYVWR